MSLAAMQRDFCAFLVDAPGAIERTLAPEAAEGLAVYHNAYRAQLVACLRDTFEKTLAWLGEEAFDDAAREHVRTAPPSSWTLGRYGDDFAATLDRLYPDDPEIGEIANLDLTLRRAFEGPDTPPLDLTALGAVDWDRARLGFVPTLRTLTITTNCVAIWSAMAEDETPPAPVMLDGRATVAIWRAGLSPQFRTLDPAEASILRAAQVGVPFADLCTLLVEEIGGETGEAAAAEMLRTWIATGLLATVS